MDNLHKSLLSGPLRAGAARVQITPPVGIEMAGYAGRQGPALGVLDELSATAIALQVADLQIGLLSCDLLSVSDELVASVRHQVMSQVGIPDGHLLIGATHTHSGPVHNVWQGTDRLECKYGTHLAGLLADVVWQAQRKMQSARVAVGAGHVQANVNRRKRNADGTIGLGENPSGIVDPSLKVIRIDDLEGNPLALIVNYAAHPVCLRPNNRLFSADWVGAMRSGLEKVIGAPVLFLQGASGNVIPSERGIATSAQRIGYQVAGEALRVFATLRTTPRFELTSPSLDFLHLTENVVAASESSPDTILGICSETIGVPLDPPLSAGAAQALVATQTALLDRLQNGASQPGQREYVASCRGWFENALDALRTRGAPATFPAEMQAIRIGDAALVAFPAEVFTEVGLAIQVNSPFQPTLFVSCANGGSVPYVPTAESFPLGGYEVEQAQRGLGMPSGLASITANLIVEKASQLLPMLEIGSRSSRADSLVVRTLTRLGIDPSE